MSDGEFNLVIDLPMAGEVFSRPGSDFATIAIGPVTLKHSIASGFTKTTLPPRWLDSMRSISLLQRSSPQRWRLRCGGAARAKSSTSAPSRGQSPVPRFAAYSSSKAGLAALSQALRRELAGSGVCVTHISPRPARAASNTAEADRFLEVMGARTDEPERVADRIVDAILARRDDVTLGRAERFYAVLNSISPRLIDRRLAGRMRSARDRFS